MTKSLNHVPLPHEDCPICGDTPILHTACEQGEAGAEDAELPEGEEYDWIATDGDLVDCPQCGWRGRVSADGESAYIVANEDGGI